MSAHRNRTRRRNGPRRAKARREARQERQAARRKVLEDWLARLDREGVTLAEEAALCRAGAPAPWCREDWRDTFLALAAACTFATRKGKESWPAYVAASAAIRSAGLATVVGGGTDPASSGTGRGQLVFRATGISYPEAGHPPAKIAALMSTDGAVRSKYEEITGLEGAAGALPFARESAEARMAGSILVALLHPETVRRTMESMGGEEGRARVERHHAELDEGIAELLAEEERERRKESGDSDAETQEQEQEQE